MKATIILLNGNEVDLHTWQSIYGLPIGGTQIGHNFNIGERSFRDGLKICEPIIRLLDVIRELKDSPIHINSLDRTAEKQEQLRLNGYRAAKFSPHVAKMAADIDTISEDDTYDLLEIIEEAAKLLNYDVRIGWQSYMKDGSTFIHVDVTPMYYAPSKVFYNESHPKVWENIIQW